MKKSATFAGKVPQLMTLGMLNTSFQNFEVVEEVEATTSTTWRWPTSLAI